MDVLSQLPAVTLNIFLEKQFDAHSLILTELTKLVECVKASTYSCLDNIELNPDNILDYASEAKIIGENLADLGNLYELFLENCLDSKVKCHHVYENFKSLVEIIFNHSAELKKVMKLETFVTSVTKDFILFKTKQYFKHLGGGKVSSSSVI